MKAVFIVFNQALTENVLFVLDRLNIRGYTQWTDTKGRGSSQGEPHLGTHTWPALNNSILTVVPEERVEKLFELLQKINEKVEEQGLKAFVWNIENVLE